MKKKKDNDQSENMDEQASNYEEMLDGFSSGDEVESDDDMALSDLLGESDSLELEGESKESTEADELKELDLDAISDLTFDDITSEETVEAKESEAEDGSVSKTDSDKFKIDLEEIEQEGSGDYSSVLSEMEGDETAEFNLIGDDTTYTVGSLTNAVITIIDSVDLIFGDSFESNPP